MSKKFLILTVTAGEGHNSISKALKNKLSENPNNQVKVIDLFKKYAGPSKSLIINDGYIAACKYAMPIYNAIFKGLQKLKPENRNKLLAQSTIMPETPKLLQDIYLYEPDVIICTHFYPAMIITNLRKVYPIPAKTIAILTDYTVHPFWEGTIGIDYIITPSNEFDEALKYKGFKQEQILDLGLPVKEDFSLYMDKKEARKALNLEENLFTVMIMLGGGGFGGADKILKKLLRVKEKIQILIVNGKDKLGKKRVDTILKNVKTKHNIVSYGFIDFVQMAMSATDIIVGKCGGITANESLNKMKPLIVNSTLAQQELENMKFLNKHGACLVMSSKNKLENIISGLVQNPEKINQLEDNIKTIRKPNALKDICDFAESLEKENTSHLPEIYQKDYSKIRLQIKKKMRIENKEILLAKRNELVLKKKNKKVRNLLDDKTKKEHINKINKKKKFKERG